MRLTVIPLILFIRKTYIFTIFCTSYKKHCILEFRESLLFFHFLYLVWLLVTELLYFLHSSPSSFFHFPSVCASLFYSSIHSVIFLHSSFFRVLHRFYVSRLCSSSTYRLYYSNPCVCIFVTV